ncbi:MAG: hypothetical protein Q7T55_08085 [Solirubrobacteraceae bacterium]|nr:hypothetical protein [Solirubrobacteraceae bacterium]
MRARSPSVVLVLAAMVSFAGCGSSDEGASSDASSKALTRTELATKADAICQTAKTDALAVDQPKDFATNPKAAATYLTAVQKITRKEQTDLAALTPDDEAKADYDAMVKSQGALADLLDGVVEKANAEDESGLQDLARSAELSKPFVAAATKIGAKGCAAG